MLRISICPGFTLMGFTILFSKCTILKEEAAANSMIGFPRDEETTAVTAAVLQCVKKKILSIIFKLLHKLHLNRIVNYHSCLGRKVSFPFAITTALITKVLQSFSRESQQQTGIYAAFINRLQIKKNQTKPQTELTY